MARAQGVCSQPGCPILKPCELHAPKPWAGSDRRSRLPKNWSSITAAVKRRDRYTCQACGGTRCGNRNLEVDHITRGDDHRMTNLQTLGAKPCHTDKTTREATEGRGGTPS
jgi:5-methylcytosine-specific restriction protein A